MYDVSMIDGHIDEPKMTDNEIVKALEGNILNAKSVDCKVWSIELYKIENALDLINRQKAEIERLTEEIELLHSDYTYKLVKNKAKSEAYKECIGKVKEEINEALKSNYKVRAERESRRPYSYLDCDVWNYCNGKIDCLRGLDYFLDNLLKEKVGE